MKKEKGFTLIELMIVISIIALLAAVALPKFSSATNDAKVANVRSQLAGLRTAIQMYNARYQVYPTVGASPANVWQATGYINGATTATGTGAVAATGGRWFGVDPANPSGSGVYDKYTLPGIPLGANVAGFGNLPDFRIGLVAAAFTTTAGSSPAGAVVTGGWAYKVANGEIHPRLMNGTGTGAAGGNRGAYEADIVWAFE